MKQAKKIPALMEHTHTHAQENRKEGESEGEGEGKGWSGCVSWPSRRNWSGTLVETDAGPSLKNVRRLPDTCLPL